MHGRRAPAVLLAGSVLIGLVAGLLLAVLLLFVWRSLTVPLPPFSCAPSYGDTPEKERLPALANAGRHSVSLSKDNGECDTTADISRQETPQMTGTAHQTPAPAGPRV